MEERIILSYKDVSLRDIIQDDVRDYIDWYTIKTDWQKWEAPWKELENIDQLEKRLKKTLEGKQPRTRRRFEIEYRGEHVGWTNSYYIDGEKDMLGIGVVIPDSRFWNRGIGEKALICFIRYILEKDPYKEIYIETLEDNERMMNLAEKLGFGHLPFINKTKEFDGKTYRILTYNLLAENIPRYRI